MTGFDHPRIGESVARIVGGRLIDPATKRDEVGELRIEYGRIAGFKPGADSTPAADGEVVIDATGMIVCPGFVDMHVHFREPGREDKETVVSGARAAVAGGVTTACCMPNTDPPLDTQEGIRFIFERAKAAPARVYPIGAITRGQEGKILTEAGEMTACGCVAFSEDGLPVADTALFRRALEYIRMFDVPVICHSEDRSLSHGGAMHEGFVSTRLGLPGIPRIAEDIGTMRDIQVAAFAGTRLHVAHVSTRGSVELIRRAKADGVRVTAEATPHHVSLADELIAAQYDTSLKMNPPLRERDDIEAVRAGLADGTIDCIATDHAPHTPEDKEGEFDRAPFGIIGLETSFAVCEKHLVREGVLSLNELIARMTHKPARILRMETGTLKDNRPADITLIDPKHPWTFGVDDIASKSCNSPYIGSEFNARVMMTIVGGEIVYAQPGIANGNGSGM